MRVSSVADALEVVNAILHRILRSQELMLSDNILLGFGIVVVVRHPRMLRRVCFVVTFLCVLLHLH